MTTKIEQADPATLTAAPDPLDAVQATLRDNMLASVRVLYAGVAAAMTPDNAARGMLLVERVSALQRHLVARLSGVVETGRMRRHSIGGVPFVTLNSGEPVPSDSPGAEEGVDGMSESDGADFAGLSSNTGTGTGTVIVPAAGTPFTGLQVSQAVENAVQSVLNEEMALPAPPQQPVNIVAQLGQELQNFAMSEPDNETFGAEAFRSILGAFTRYQRSLEPSPEKIRETQVRSTKTLLESARTLGDAELIARFEARLRELLHESTGEPSPETSERVPIGRVYPAGDMRNHAVLDGMELRDPRLDAQQRAAQTPFTFTITNPPRNRPANDPGGIVPASNDPSGIETPPEEPAGETYMPSDEACADAAEARASAGMDEPEPPRRPGGNYAEWDGLDANPRV